jgi:hypothetical protein
MQRPCLGGCGKTVPADHFHCGNADCYWKAYNIVEDALAKRNRRHVRKETLAPFPKAPLIEAWNTIAQRRAAA